MSEAENEAGALYGKLRLTAVLEKLPRDASAAATLAAVRADLDAFIGAAEPSDDVTLLVMRWLGARGS